MCNDKIPSQPKLSSYLVSALQSSILYMKLSLVIQAGGKSRRMGQDKALLDFGGRPLIQHIFERLDSIADEVLIISNHGSYTFLGVTIIPDVIPACGPLGGFYTAMVKAVNPLVAVVACDMPFVSPSLFIYQYQILENEAFDATIPLGSDGFEPFHAVYRKQACLPSLKTTLDAGELCIHPWLEVLRLRCLTPEEIIPFDPDGRAFMNTNTPTEFERALQMHARCK